MSLKTNQKVVCNSCFGTGVSNVFVNTGIDSSKHYTKTIICTYCNGELFITPDKHKKLEDRRKNFNALLKEIDLNVKSNR